MATEDDIAPQSTLLGGDFPVLADEETASDDYARRFSGAAGRWLLSVQSRILRRLLTPLVKGRTTALRVADVGGGHGQTASALFEDWEYASKVEITVLGSSPKAARTLEKLKLPVRYETRNLFATGLPDGSFDAVVSLRLLPHLDDWQAIIPELCRLSSGLVVVDYPVLRGANALTPFLFGMKKRIEKNTRTYISIADSDIDREFAKCGYTLRAREGEFILPMVLHRILKSPGLSEALEMMTGSFGIRRRFGTPVLASYQKQA